MQNCPGLYNLVRQTGCPPLVPEVPLVPVLELLFPPVELAPWLDPAEVFPLLVPTEEPAEVPADEPVELPVDVPVAVLPPLALPELPALEALAVGTGSSSEALP